MTNEEALARVWQMLIDADSRENEKGMHPIHDDPLRHYPHLIHLLAFQRAMRIVKQQLAAQNVKIWDVTSRDLKLWADGYLKTHRAELYEATIRMVRTDPEFLKLGESEAKRRGGCGH